MTCVIDKTFSMVLRGEKLVQSLDLGQLWRLFDNDIVKCAIISFDVDKEQISISSISISDIEYAYPAIPMNMPPETFLNHIKSVKKIVIKPHNGTEFQKLVWDRISKIPYGETLTYSELATAIGRPRACRSVGATCANNVLALVIPCHRVIPKGKNCTGEYRWGALLKSEILAFEKDTKSK